MKGKYIIVGLLLLYPCLSLAASYEFKDYPVKSSSEPAEVFIKPSVIQKLKEIKLTNGSTAFDYVQKKANFAGHYEVVEWSCGLPCRQAVIINLISGDIVGSIDSCFGLEFRIDSYLLIDKADERESLEYCTKQHYHLLKNETIIKLE